MQRIDSPEAIVSASKLYGQDTAVKLFGDIVEWHELASAEFGLDTSNDIKVKLGASEYHAGAEFNPVDGSVNLFIPLKLDGEAVALVGRAMVHENAHRKRDEVVSHCWETHEDPRDGLFCTFIDEGLASFSESEILGGDPWIAFTEEEQKDVRFIDGLILDLLYFTKIDGNTSESKLNRYLHGVAGKFEGRSYKVGHFIVARAVLLNGLTLNEALVMPDEFYKEFAEERL